MKEEIWNELYLYYLIRIEIGVFKNFKECARSPCNGNHFSSYMYVGMYDCRGPKSVGGNTWAKRAHAQSQYCAVKSDQ